MRVCVNVLTMMDGRGTLGQPWDLYLDQQKGKYLRHRKRFASTKPMTGLPRARSTSTRKRQSLEKKRYVCSRAADSKSE